MIDHQSIILLEESLEALKAGEAEAVSKVLTALDKMGIHSHEETPEISVGRISSSLGVAIGNNIRMVINQEAATLPEGIERKLSTILNALTQRDIKDGAQRHFRVFLSSPTDVTDERALAMRVINSLSYDPLLRGQVSLEVVAWDQPDSGTPMLATLTPQEAINRSLARPSDCDIVVSIFWSRMGTPLSEAYHKPEIFQFDHGTAWEDWRYLSGTEWEYIDAIQQATKTGKPLVIVYRRMDEPQIGLRDPQRDQKIAQYELVEAFFSSFIDEDGIARRGVNFYDSPSDFEAQFENHLRDLIAKLMVQTVTKTKQEPADIDVEPVALWEGSPFPGLRPFGPEDAQIFFGRGSETDDLLRHMARDQFVAVVGASGSGKSSLVGAGLLPRLAAGAIEGSQDWVVVRFTPDELGSGSPFAALASALKASPLAIDEQYLADYLRASPEAFPTLCLEAMPVDQPWAEVVLFVDQFEELFTRISPETHLLFIRLLKHSADTDRMRVVLTIRADYYVRCVEDPTMAELMKNHTYPLAAPKRDTLREMIERPAERAGLRFEVGLVRHILDDSGDAPGSLALLAFALQQLYDGRQGEELTFAAYRSFGGVQGAIGEQAQVAFDALDQKARDALPLVFRELIEVNDEKPPSRRRTALSVIAVNQDAARLVAELTNKRLLVQAHGESGNPVVEVAHEALFKSWKLLEDWIREVSEDLTYGRKLQRDLQTWEAESRHPDYLLRGSQLDRATEWLSRARENALVNDEQSEFVNISQQERERQEATEIARRRREVRLIIAFVVTIFVVACGALVAGFVGRDPDGAKERAGEIASDTMYLTYPQLCVAGSNLILADVLADGIADDIGMATLWNAEFEANHNVRVQTKALGNYAGVRAAASGECVHVLAMSEPMTVDQEDTLVDAGVDIICAAEIGYDSIAFIAGTGDKVSYLSIPSLRQILLGDIDNWSQLGSEESPITLLVREGSTYTETVLLNLAGHTPTIEQPFPPSALNYIPCSSNENCLDRALNTPGALYWVNTTWLNTQPTEYINTVPILARDDSNPGDPLSRDFIIEDYPSQLVQPLYLYVVDNGTATDHELELAKAYLYYVRSIPGQAVLQRFGFINQFRRPADLIPPLPTGFEFTDSNRAICK